MQKGPQTIILVTRLQGGVAIDGVSKTFKDEAGLNTECKRGVALGFYGAALGQPAQLGVTNAPTWAALLLTQRKIEFHDDRVNRC